MKYHLKTDFRTSPPKVFQRQKGGSYYTRQRIGGHDTWRSLHTKNKREAEQFAYQIWYQQQNSQIRDILAMPSLPFNLVWALHIETEKYTLLAPATKSVRFKYFQLFRKFCEERSILNINDITTELAEIFLSGLGKTNKTFNNVLNDLRQTFKNICEQNHTNNIFNSISPRSTTRGDRISSDYREFSIDEIKLILTLLEQSTLKYKTEWITACNIALYTGLRYKDIALLQWKHIKNNEYIELIPHKTTNSTNKYVIIPICSALKSILKSIPKTNFYILSSLGENYDANSTRQFMRFLNYNRKKFAPGKIGFHSFRTTFVTWAADAGLDLEKLGGVVGHTSTVMTDHYNKSAATLDFSFLETKQIS